MGKPLHKQEKPNTEGWKDRWHEIIFEADTPAGRRFDVALLWMIVLSVIVIILESVPSIKKEYKQILIVIEYVFNGFFTLEYIMRILVVKKPWKYIFSFFGLVDLMSILPTYFAIFGIGTSSLLVIRILRFMRVFRILKLIGFAKQAALLREALKASRQKISVFLMAVMSIVVIIGTVMYIIEGPERGFTSIPVSIYWAIVTITTVGYGDISPQTPLGQTIASMMMILGYAILAVPTGIVTGEIARTTTDKSFNTINCPSCSREGHDDDAKHCKYCGHEL
ncbi:MAG: ion transporter, partial [Flavobacteriales bacterium]|nr:ion transporter [Flavobacteriales bacterium]